MRFTVERSIVDETWVIVDTAEDGVVEGAESKGEAMMIAAELNASA